MAEYLKGAKGSWMWVILRLYLGYAWVTAGWHKVVDGFDASGFIKGAIAKSVPASPGAKPVVQAWWGSFLDNVALPNAKVFSFLVAYGEVLVGLALILGFATIFAAVMGMVMNFSFILSGSVSTSPNMLAIAFVIVAVGGAYAGYIGVDYWFRPWFRNTMASLLGGKEAAARSAS